MSYVLLIFICTINKLEIHQQQSCYFLLIKHKLWFYLPFEKVRDGYPLQKINHTSFLNDTIFYYLNSWYIFFIFLSSPIRSYWNFIQLCDINFNKLSESKNNKRIIEEYYCLPHWVIQEKKNIVFKFDRFVFRFIYECC